MREIQIEHREQNNTLKTDNFDEILGWQAKDAAKRIVEEETIVKPAESNNTLRNKWIATGVGATAVISGLVGLNALDGSFEPTQTFSKKTTNFILDKNDGLYDAAQSIPGIDTIDIRDAVLYISNLPDNKAIIETGTHPGGHLVVPVSINGVEPSNEQ